METEIHNYIQKIYKIKIMDNKKQLDKDMDYNVELTTFHKLNPFVHPAPGHGRELHQKLNVPLVLSSSYHEPRE